MQRRLFVHAQQIGPGQIHLPLAGGGVGQLLRQGRPVSGGQRVPVGLEVVQQPVHRRQQGGWLREKSCVHNPTSRAATRVQPRKEEPSKPLH